MIFEMKDYAGNLVKLNEETWQKKAGNGLPGDHPEIHEYFVDIQSAIESPDLVFESTRDRRSHAFYRLAGGRGDFIGKHLVVILTYAHE